MSEDLDMHIKNALDARYKVVLKKLEAYKDCIENIVLSLKKNESIDGDQLREIIHAYEDEKGIESLKKRKEKDTSDEKYASDEKDSSDEK